MIQYPKKIFLLLSLGLIVTSCSGKNLNFPPPSAMPVITDQAQPRKVSCGTEFERSMNFYELASAASDMHLVCGLSKTEILILARRLN